MNGKAISVGACLWLLAAAAAAEDQITLIQGGKVKGSVVGVRFQVGEERKTYTREEIKAIELGSGQRADDVLVLKDGASVQGVIAYVEIRTLAGDVPFPRARIASLLLADETAIKAPPVTKTSALADEYDDEVKLAIGAQLKVVVLTVSVAASGKETTFTRHSLEAVRLPEGVVVTTGGKETRGGIRSVRLKTAQAVATFAGGELSWIKLAARAAPAPPKYAEDVLTEDQEKALTANRRLHEEQARRLAADHKAATDALAGKFDGALKTAERDMDSQARTAANERLSLRQLQNQIDDLLRQLRQTADANEKRMLQQQLTNAQTSLRQALGNLQKADRQAADARTQRDQLAQQRKDEEAELRQWHASQHQVLDDVRAKHAFLLLAKVKLTDEQMDAAYRAGLAKAPLPQGKPVPGAPARTGGGTGGRRPPGG